MRTHTAKRLVSFSQPSPSQPSSSSHRKEPVRLAFADGTRAACDVLVGADGVRSAVRAGMLSSPDAGAGTGAGAGADAEEARKARCVWSGTMSYRATVPAAALRARWPGHRVLQEPYVVSAWCVIFFAFFLGEGGRWMRLDEEEEFFGGEEAEER